MDTNFGNHQEKLFFEAAKLNLSKTQLTNISYYFPRSQAEIETQEFNINCKIPRRLLSDEELAMWFLESEKLNRAKVEIYLSTENDSFARGALEKLALKICSLEIAYGFVDGLKFFLPVVGCWSSNDNNNWNIKSSSQNHNALRYILKIYVQAHLQYSKTPLFATGFENIPVIIDIAFSVLNLCKTLENSSTPQAVVMSEFFASLRTIIKRGDGLTMSVKGMTDLFAAVSSGRPMSALQLPANLPSYLFATESLSSYVTVGFRLDDVCKTYYARLGSDALYLFDPFSNEHTHNNPRNTIQSSPCKLRFCIPLNRVHVQITSENSDTSSSDHHFSSRGGRGRGEAVLELVSISALPLQVIEFNTDEYHESQALYEQLEAISVKRVDIGASSATTSLASVHGDSAVKRNTIVWPGPKSVAQFDSVYITLTSKPVSSSKQNADEADSGGEEEDDDLSERSLMWMDALENSCWDSRV